LKVTLFLLTFFLIYGGFHFFFFLKIRAVYAPGVAVQVIIVALLVLALMAPVIIRVCERYGLEMPARILSWAGYLWMAFLLFFFFTFAVLEIFQLLIHWIGQSFRIDFGALLPERMLFMIPAAVALGVVIYGAFDARCIRSESLVIRSAKIPKDAGRIRIVQISDVHVGLLVHGSYLEKILRKIQEAQPDILVSTGDLVDGQGNNLAEAAAGFRQIHPRYGKFAVTGNHEFYAGIEAALDFTAKAGFTILRGDVATVTGAAVNLVGIDDPGIHGFGAQGRSSDRDALARGVNGCFTILLKHRPLVEKDAAGTFDLQLSGHTHQGQILPFNLITRLVFPFHAGDYRLMGGALLHVSRGTGTWGPPVRFWAPPEITVIDLMPE
jgi:uncharacterized protein